MINYNITLTLTIAYYINSNFASQYIMDIFGLVLIIRPGLICLYTVFISCTEFHKTCVSRRRFMKQKKLDEKNFEMVEELKKKGKMNKIHSEQHLDEAEAKRQQAKT